MVNHRLYICTVYPGSRHASILKVVGFLLDDDKPLLQKIVVHKPTKKKWWLDFQGYEIPVWVFSTPTEIKRSKAPTCYNVLGYFGIPNFRNKSRLPTTGCFSLCFRCLWVARKKKYDIIVANSKLLKLQSRHLHAKIHTKTLRWSYIPPQHSQRPHPSPLITDPQCGPV